VWEFADYLRVSSDAAVATTSLLLPHPSDPEYTEASWATLLCNCARQSEAVWSNVDGTHLSNEPSSAALCRIVSAAQDQHGMSMARARLVPDVMAGSLWW